MKYLCLIYYDEAKLEALSAAEYEALIDENHEIIADLQENGHFLGANKLQPTRTASTVRVRNDKLSATDGPFAETKEQLGGYLLIEAADLNESIRIASRFPPARFGCIEVRPVEEFRTGL
jgi:hypothetical protein